MADIILDSLLNGYVNSLKFSISDQFRFTLDEENFYTMFLEFLQ